MRVRQDKPAVSAVPEGLWRSGARRARGWRLAVMTLTVIGGLLVFAGTASAQTMTIRVRPVWASGEIAIVDGIGRVLVVRQGRHVMTFRLGPDTRFVRRREPVDVRDLRDLREHVGERVKISYTIVSGSRVALRIVVTEPADAREP